MTLRTMLITADPGIAAHVTAAGNDTLFIDLEAMGKAARQGHLDTWKSPHGPEDISALRRAAPEAELLVRLNPLHDGSPAEVEDALTRGADALMLPMFRDCETLERFADLVAARAKLVPLVETKGALDAIPQILARVRPDRLHIGLNDLSLDLGLGFLFQPLTEGLLEAPCAALREAATPFGIGGVARLGQGQVPADMVLGEHVRLGSTWVILARSFHDRAATLPELTARVDFGAELARLRACYGDWQAAAPARLEQNRKDLAARVAEVANQGR